MPFDFLTNLFSGGQQRGMEEFEKMIRQGMNQTRGATNEANKMLDPYSKMAQQQMPEFLKYTQQMQDSPNFIKQLLGQYQQSPWAKNMTNEATNQMQAAASRSGSLGSTNLLNQIGQKAGDISSMDQQNWLNNVMGAKQQGMQGLEKFLGMTNPAFYGQSNNMMDFARMIPQFYSQMGAARQGQEQAKSGGLQGLIGLGANMLFPGLGSIFG